MEVSGLSGVYLVLDPTMEGVLEKLSRALKGGLGMIQIWNHWPTDYSVHQKHSLIHQIKQLAMVHNTPVLMHDDWEISVELGLEGVHFDEAPKNWKQARIALKDKTIGLTVGNDLTKISWADKEAFSYLSFCAMFPSPSVGSCEIVSPDSVRNTREITDLPLFLSGGIRPDNLNELENLDFQGIAIISGIMSADDPETAVRAYNQKLKELRNIDII